MDSKWVPGTVGMLGTRYGKQVGTRSRYAGHQLGIWCAPGAAGLGMQVWVQTRYLLGTRSRYAGYLVGIWKVFTGYFMGIWWVFGGYGWVFGGYLVPPVNS